MSKVLEMSDDDFLKHGSPEALDTAVPDPTPSAASTEATETNTPAEPEASQKEEVNPEAVSQTQEAEAATGDEVVPPVEGKQTPEPKEPVASGKPAAKEVTTPELNVDGSAKTDGAKEPVGKEGDPSASGSKETPAAEAPNYEELYNQMMAPFKANGKQIKLNSPEEAQKLMQMGANYTKKMQELQPHRKIITMLQNNNLMDESQLSFLIDLSKKDPAAIQKLLKDSNIDPLSIDVTADPSYKEGSHLVSDESVNFTTALDELTSNPEGAETVRIMHADWDKASKDELWKKPELMAAIHAQRQNGIYGRITEEIDRRKTLGEIPAGVSFLQAYKAVGDAIQAKNGFADLAPKQELEKKPLATKVITKPVPKNDKVSAASSPRSASLKAETSKNYFAQSDDEFLAQMKNRV